jgi:hypothetical protein
MASSTVTWIVVLAIIAYLVAGILFAASTGMFGDTFGGFVPTGATATTTSASAGAGRSGVPAPTATVRP